MATSLFDVVPLLSHCTSTRFQGKISENSCGWTGNFILMMELRKKILTFRDVIDLPPCDGSSPINELVMGTVEDLHNLYPKIVSHNVVPETEKISIEQGLVLLYNALKSIGDSWAKNHEWIDNTGHDSQDSLDNVVALEQLGGRLMSKLNHATRVAKQIFDVMEEDERNSNVSGIIRGSTIGDALTESYSDSKLNTCPSPNTPTDYQSYNSLLTPAPKPLLLPFCRLKAVQNLKPVGIKHLFSLDLSPVKHKTSPSINTSTSPSTNTSTSPSTSVVVAGDQSAVQKKEVISDIVAPPKPPPPPVPPPPMMMKSSGKGSSPAAPPPPPVGAGKLLRPKKAATKLKRSSHMGSLYRALKGQVEGSSFSGLNGNNGKRSHAGVGSAGGKQGMADALAEMTKRSAYFQQIEKDVEKHSKSVLEIKAAITSFQTNDMTELVKFHEFVEQHLEKLTDETQVLARFEGFPTKKLETLRTATALYLKLEEMVNTLKNWKIVPPLTQLLDKVESFFTKMKKEIDALERSKDEDCKRFQSHNIKFDFTIFDRIKESMVDVSSSCMELTLKERKNTKMLWRAFQLAFRVYSFAGGQDERADRLTHELALQIQTDH